MTLPELKEKINNNQFANSLIIFKCEDEDFIPISYIKQWAVIKCAQIKYINNLDEIVEDNPFFNDSNLPSLLYVYETDYLDELPSEYKWKDNLFIICDRIKKEISDEFKNLIVNVPKLETWQIKDYCSLNYKGFEDSQLEWLITSCRGSIYKTLIELNKLNVFPPATRKNLFEELKRNNQFDEIGEYQVFDLINAIQTKNLDKVNLILDSNLELNSIGLSTLLYNSFKNLIKVWLNKQPTELNTGLKSNQIGAINRLPRVYTKEQLIQIFKLLTEVDYKIKSGELSENILLDYLITQILTI